MKIYSIADRLRDIAVASAVFALSTFTLLSAGSIALAEDTSCTPPSSDQAGVHYPVGADAATFTYQCSGAYAGKWTNPYYVYNPATSARTPLYSPDYKYDCTTKTWSMIHWDYSPSRGTFVSSRVAPTAAPTLPTGCVAPTPAVSTGSTGGNSTPTTGNHPSTLTNTGPHSSNSANNNLTLNGSITNNTGASMNNTIGSQATTGDSAVVGNTTGGSANSGNAEAMATVANLLQSTSNVFGPNTVTFTADINGTVNGDFMLDPSAILASGPGSSNNTSNNLQVNTAAANTTDATIHNTIDVGANSGNATVASNTTGGNATSGNATAIVNLMNLINSTVASGKSFVGTIDINGDLNGDILLPQGVLDQLLASSGPGSSNNTVANLASTSTVNNNVTEAVANNIQSSATSGLAAVNGNTTGGAATSGNSGTNLTLLNLTGSNTVGKDDLLVFVNVLGKWVGMIMNAPSGSTAADLGGGITSSGPGSANNTTANLASNSTLNNTANLGITNDVNVHAQSGNATVTHNTLGGNATSGNAHTAVNVLNMTGSNLSLSDWFGVLFINVFGMWNGSFGVNTSAGDPVVVDPGVPTNNPVQKTTQEQMIHSFRRFATFTARGTGGGNSHNIPAPRFQTAAVLGSTTPAAAQISATTTPQPSSTRTTSPHANYLLPAIGFALAGLILAAGERDRLFGHNKHRR